MTFRPSTVLRPLPPYKSPFSGTRTRVQVPSPGSSQHTGPGIYLALCQ